MISGKIDRPFKQKTKVAMVVVVVAVIADIEDAVACGSLGYWHQRAGERHGNPPPR